MPEPAEPLGEPDPGRRGRHCTGCGRPAEACAGCQWEYDPPRFCGCCGTRLAVRVTPAGWRARCKHHGEARPA